MHEQISLGVQHHEEAALARCVSGGSTRERLPCNGDELVVQLDLPALCPELGIGISDLGDDSVLEGLGVGLRCRPLGSCSGDARTGFAAAPDGQVPLYTDEEAIREAG